MDERAWWQSSLCRKGTRGLRFRYVEFEIPPWHPCGDVKQEENQGNLEFWKEVRDRHVDETTVMSTLHEGRELDEII